MQSKAYKAFFYVSLSSLICTLALVTLGGIVHNTGSSLACPDWPLCFGQVLPKMEGQVGIEHSHRLLATFVGILSIILVILSKKFKDQRPDLYKFAWIALIAVIAQGILGGITVLLKISPLVSTMHLSLSQIFFGFILYICLKSRPFFLDAFAAGSQRALDKTSIKWLTWALVILYIQIVWGAAVRHSGAGAACGLGPYYSVLCMNDQTEGLTLWPNQAPSIFHVLHRYLGVLVAGLIIYATLPTLRWAKAHSLKLIRFLCIAAHAIVVVQVALGILTVWTYIGITAVTLHLVGAGLLFSVMLTLNILTRESRETSDLVSRKAAWATT